MEQQANGSSLNCLSVNIAPKIAALWILGGGNHAGACAVDNASIATHWHMKQLYLFLKILDNKMDGIKTMKGDRKRKRSHDVLSQF